MFYPPWGQIKRATMWHFFLKTWGHVHANTAGSVARLFCNVNLLFKIFCPSGNQFLQFQQCFKTQASVRKSRCVVLKEMCFQADSWDSTVHGTFPWWHTLQSTSSFRLGAKSQLETPTLYQDSQEHVVERSLSNSMPCNTDDTNGEATCQEKQAATAHLC